MVMQRGRVSSARTIGDGFEDREGRVSSVDLIRKLSKAWRISPGSDHDVGLSVRPSHFDGQVLLLHHHGSPLFLGDL